jgi:DNA repair exonuclease SbcCD ATPase subunit
VIQSTLFFVLGVLCAGFLALLIAPALWRRAVALTRKRIEASMPLTLNEMQAGMDRVRAEAAMNIRRLEISVKSLKEKVANQLIEINRSREELRRLAGENAEKTRPLAELVAKVPELQAKLRERDQQVENLSKRLGEADDIIEKRALEFEKLGETYEEISFMSSSRQIELAGLESEIERLSTDVSRLRSQRADAERRLQDATTDKQALEETLKAERRRVADLERKVEQMLSALTEREQRLEQGERELARLRQKFEMEPANENNHDRGATNFEPSKTDLASSEPPIGQEEEADTRLARLSAERDRLEGRLTALTRENRRLRVGTNADTESANGQRDNSAVLREQIHQLAAEVVNLTAKLDEPDSPIHKALSMPPANGTAAGSVGRKVLSLADRIRALQKAVPGD